MQQSLIFVREIIEAVLTSDSLDDPTSDGGPVSGTEVSKFPLVASTGYKGDITKRGFKVNIVDKKTKAKIKIPNQSSTEIFQPQFKP